VRRRAGSHTYAKEYQVPAGELTKVAEADLELLGEARLAVKGTDLEEGRINWYSFGALGSYRGLGYSLSESQYGRIAPDGTSLTSFAGFAMVNTGLGVEAGLEVSVPGRVGWRVGRGSGFEWMPWVGFPYYWHGPSDDDPMLRVGVSVGLDAWADLSGRSRLGLNLGASSNEWGEANRFDVWAAAGHGFARGDHWRIHIGLGFAHTVADLAATASLADQRDRISLGGVLTDGVLPLPLVEFRADESLSFGLTAQLDFRLPDADFGYQATLGWTWRFVSDDTMPEQ
jgi:hypothetical protein